jgi:hypothetical protein
MGAVTEVRLAVVSPVCATGLVRVRDHFSRTTPLTGGDISSCIQTLTRIWSNKC